MKEYEVELKTKEVEFVGSIRYFSVIIDEREYTVIEDTYTNPEWLDWEVTDEEGDEVENTELKQELIDAVVEHEGL